MADMLKLTKEAQEIVEGKPLWKRFIDGTPLSNDIAVWMAEFALDAAEQARAEALTEAANALEPLKARWLPNVRDIYVVGECAATIRALAPKPPAHPKQIAGVGCALCGRNEAGYYCTGDCGAYQDAADPSPSQGTEPKGT